MERKTSNLLDKKAIRASIKVQKSMLSPEAVNVRTEKILENLYRCEAFINANRIYTYVNYNQEVNTMMLIKKAWIDGKKVLVPRVCGNEMNFYYIESLSDLEPGAYEIPEPVESCRIDELNTGVMIMPGLAFDKSYHRIGYGGGFYDKYLEKFPAFIKIALCYDFQVLDVINTDTFDIPVDMIISETKVF